MASPSNRHSAMTKRMREFTPSDNKDATLKNLWCFYNVLDCAGQANLADDILGCADDQAIRNIAKSIIEGLISPLKAGRGKTPAEITPSPRQGLEESIEDLIAQGIDPVTRGLQGQLRTHCMERDGNRCVVTGFWDPNEPHPESDLVSWGLDAAHIVPYTMGASNPNKREEVRRNASIWATFKRYFPTLDRISFSSSEINTERNMMILFPGIHVLLGQFRLLFEETRTRNIYKIKTFKGAPGIITRDLPKDRLVTFKVHAGRWDLPDPQLLKIHAAIGNFLNMSGQGELTDKILRDFGECGGLAPSGATDVEALLSVSGLSLLDTNLYPTN